MLKRSAGFLWLIPGISIAQPHDKGEQVGKSNLEQVVSSFIPFELTSARTNFQEHFPQARRSIPEVLLPELGSCLREISRSHDEK
jgi:hypothetical protein